MPNITKPNRVLTLNGRDYLVADSVKNELLLQLMTLFSDQLLTPVGERHLYDYTTPSRNVLVCEPREVNAGLSITMRELLTRDECDVLEKEFSARRDAFHKEREEAAKNAK
jgi:hypothetical protein